MTNTTGTFAGAMIGALFRRGSRGGRLLQGWLEGFRPGEVVIAGLCALGMWILSQLSPFVPVLERDVLRDNLKPAWQVAHGAYAWRPFQFACNFFYLASALLLLRQLRKPGQAGRAVTLYFFLIAAGVLVVRPFIYKHQVSLEAMVALSVLATVVTLFPRLLTIDQNPIWTLLLLLAGFIAYELEPAAGAYTSFNWVPFAAQNEVPLTSLNNILATTWPFLAAGSAAALGAFEIMDRTRARRIAVLGGIAVLVIAWALELAQCHIRGRYGDITTVLLGVAAWSVPWFLAGESSQEVDMHSRVTSGLRAG
jgi:hypothetical protein